MLTSGGPERSVGIRDLLATDRDVLVWATLVNINWCGERFTVGQVESLPEFSRYTMVRPERGDFGFVALEDGDGVGVVWVLYLPAAEAGYGYIEDGVGELSVCVREGYRGKGIGSRLIGLALRRAAERGEDRISLSVEDGNPARGLYARLGFRDAGPGHPQGTMVADLRNR